MENDERYPRYYRKAIRGTVAGRFMNKKGEEREFVLKGNPYDSNTDQDDISIAIYDTDGEEYFLKRNKATIRNGYMIEVGDYEFSLDETNAVSDGYLRDLLKLPPAKLKTRVNKFTSPIPIHRLLVFAKEEDKPIKTIEFLEHAKQKLDYEPIKLPDRITR